MSRDDIIEKAALLLARSNGTEWDLSSEPDDVYRRDARALADAGLLVSELPPEPLPVGQVRVGPYGTCIGLRFSEEDYPWHCSDRKRRDDDQVRHWSVMIREDDPRVMPEGHVAVDVSGVPSSSLRHWIKNRIHASGWFLENIARAELARRGEQS